MNDFSSSGNWWLPRKQEKQIYGELNFSQTVGGTLFLSDAYEKLWDFPRDKQDFLLLGDLIAEGKSTKVSVIISLITDHKTKSSPKKTTIDIVLKVKYIFLEVHVEDNNIEFEKIAVSYSNLNDWISAIHDLKLDKSQHELTYSSPAICVE